MRKRIRLLLAVTAVCVLAYSLWGMYTFGTQASASEKLNADLSGQAVTVKKPAPAETRDPSAPTLETAPPEEDLEEAPIEVDFDMLREESVNIVGWLYCEDTLLNLPVAQAGDNDYYLRRLLDGTGNNSGTLFADYRNDRRFSDRNTIIYGHNMRNGTMFGSLRNYADQAYYDEHPVMWLLTPTDQYKLELVAGFTTPAVSDTYSIPETDEEMLELVKNARENSTFQADLELSETDRYVTLSTCTYEYDNARYVLIGRLVKLGKE